MRMTRFCACAVAAIAFVAGHNARASYVVTFQQVGSDVIATGNGSMDTTDLTFGAANPNQPAIVVGFFGIVSLGSASPTGDPISFATGSITGPTSFGSGLFFAATSGSGPIAGIEGVTEQLNVPENYVSGTTLATSTDTWSNQTFSSLGLTPGTYTYNWGTGPHADTFTVQINDGVAAPLPPAALSAVPLLAALLLFKKRRPHSA
jgi:hypothetical protein